MSSKNTDHFVNTAHLANFCAVTQGNLEENESGLAYIAQLARQYGPRSVFSTQDYWNGIKISTRAYMNESLSGGFKFLYKYAPAGNTYFRYKRDVFFLRSSEGLFKLVTFRITPQRMADKAPVEAYRPEFGEIARHLCLPTIAEILEKVGKRAQTLASSGHSPEKGPT